LAREIGCTRFTDGAPERSGEDVDEAQAHGGALMPARRRPVAAGWKGRTLFAIGHSTRSAAELVRLLQCHHVDLLADVRTVPKSRTNPQFNSAAFAKTLQPEGIEYAHVSALGGLRRPRKDSRNTGWRNESFRGFADYMQTEEFAAGLETLRELSADHVVAMMCAEARRWRCHRSLVADALFARGVVVQHIVSCTKTEPHAPTPFARIRGLTVTYPPEVATKEAVRPGPRPR
jgi:uncharacterized protein (DUF488 family)